MLDLPAAAPITVIPPTVLEVTPGPLFTPGKLGAPLLPNRSLLCDFRPASILVGRYQIQEEIGRGGFSIVYRAVDLDVNHREVAIKRIQLNTLTPRQVIDATEACHREISMLVRFRWVDGIPKFYEHLADAENWYLILQYIAGQTLEDYLQQAPGGVLTEEETIELGGTLAQLLQKLHAEDPPVIFRDLKPSNIMITPERKLFLIDFGIARNFTPGKKKDTTPFGSPGFAPPEQYGSSQTDQRADIYSLGATLQTLFTGCDPLELRAGEPARNHSHPSHALSKLLAQMQSPVVKRRPASMNAIKRRLQSARRRPFPSYLAGLIVTVIISGILAFVVVSGWGGVMGGAIGGLSMTVVNITRQRFKKRYGAQRFTWSFALLGSLTGLLPFLLFILWRIFWWPF